MVHRAVSCGSWQILRISNSCSGARSVIQCTRLVPSSKCRVIAASNRDLNETNAAGTSFPSAMKDCHIRTLSEESYLYFQLGSLESEVCRRVVSALSLVGRLFSIK